jgi:hypothetical protein
MDNGMITPMSSVTAAERPTKETLSSAAKPISIFYEHPRWFDRMFAEFDRRGTPYRKIPADQHFFDPGALGLDEDVSIIFNRMSPSAYRRDRGRSILHTINYLQHLELLGKRVINGSKAFRFEISKALQLSLLRSLGLPFPKARVIQNSSHAAEAAHGLRFPVVIKPNVGGSGAGVVRFDSLDALAAATNDGGVDLGLDGIGLVQEFIPARGGHITRVEGIGGKFLYAINVYLSGETFDLCPADICRTPEGVSLDTTCPVEAPKAGLRVEGYHPPATVIAEIERTFVATGIDVGGIEYVIDDRDGQLYYYDINALSNFVADAPKVVGFDPFVNLVDFLEEEASRV